MYAFAFQDKAFGPTGVIKDVEGTPLEVKDVDAYNQSLEAQEIEHIKTGPDKLVLYVGKKPMQGDPAKICGVYLPATYNGSYVWCAISRMVYGI
jgi:hypothetical protein